MAAGFEIVGPGLFIACLCIVFGAGIVKGVTGFALPMVAVSGIGSIARPEVAIAAIILPSLVANAMQAVRGGRAGVAESIRPHWLLLVVMIVGVAITARLALTMPDAVFFGLLGTFTTVFGAIQLAGWQPSIPDRLARPVEVLTGALAGVSGGLAGIWGPPIVLYLLARRTPKRDMVRLQGAAYTIGSVVLTGTHLAAGFLWGWVALFSAAMVVPAVLGMWIGQHIQDRLEPRVFRLVVLAVLVLAGLNLLRRAAAA